MKLRLIQTVIEAFLFFKYLVWISSDNSAYAQFSNVLFEIIWFF